MQVVIDVKDSEEDIRKAIAILQKLLEEKEGRQERIPLEEPEPKIEMLISAPEPKEKNDATNVLAQLLAKKETPRKKDEAFDVGELIPY